METRFGQKWSRIVSPSDLVPPVKISGMFWPTIALGTLGGFPVASMMGFGWRSRPAPDVLHPGRLERRYLEHHFWIGGADQKR